MPPYHITEILRILCEDLAFDGNNPKVVTASIKVRLVCLFFDYIYADEYKYGALRELNDEIIDLIRELNDEIIDFIRELNDEIIDLIRELNDEIIDLIRELNDEIIDLIRSNMFIVYMCTILF